MKKTLLFLFVIITVAIQAQSTNFIHTSGKYILGPCNDTLRIKGINYAPYNWGYTLSDLKINEIAQSGANAVRLVWYSNNPGANVYTNYVALDSAISKCVQNKMIVMLELHDFTCGSNASGLISGSAWWTSSSVLSILNKYKQSIIINIANEALQVAWASNPTTALATYKSTYQTIITNLRSVAGFDFPLMIDAPDCGVNSDVFITNNTAADLITFDPKHNIIFSAHAYWYSYAGNDSLQMATKINNVITQNIPFVLGEISNQQDDVSMCQYNLNYKPLLNFCESKKISWLAWSWDHDGCPNRQISSTGLFSNLTVYGNDIINNSKYGLSTHPAAKSQFLVNNGNCSTAADVHELQCTKFTLTPNPSNGVFKINTAEKNYKLICRNIFGHELALKIISENTYCVEATSGIYFITLLQDNFKQTIKLIVN